MMRPRMEYMIARVILWAARRSVEVACQHGNIADVKWAARHRDHMAARFADAAEALQHARAGLR